MNIVYLNKVGIDENLPAVNFTIQNAYGLAQAGASCHLFVQKSQSDFDESRIFEDLGLDKLENLSLNVLAKVRRFGIQSNQWFYLNAIKEIRLLHKRCHIDALISRDPGALPYIVNLKKKTNIPVFYQPHNFYLDLKVRPDVNRVNSRKYHLLEKRYISRVTALLCLQNSQAEWYRKYLPGMKIFAAKPGLIKIQRSGDEVFGNRLIGYIGSLKTIKGVETILDAMQVLKTEGFKLLIVGGRSTAEIEPIHRRICDLDLDDSVKITGWLPFSEAANHINRMSVGVIPLTDTFYNRYLTAPNKLFDYLSRAIPIVATDLPAIREFIPDGKAGILIKPETPEKLVEAVRGLFISKKYYQKYRRHAAMIAESYLWTSRGSHMMKLMEPFV